MTEQERGQARERASERARARVRLPPQARDSTKLRSQGALAARPSRAAASRRRAENAAPRRPRRRTALAQLPWRAARKRNAVMLGPRLRSRATELLCCELLRVVRVACPLRCVRTTSIECVRVAATRSGLRHVASPTRCISVSARSASPFYSRRHALCLRLLHCRSCARGVLLHCRALTAPAVVSCWRANCVRPFHPARPAGDQQRLGLCGLRDDGRAVPLASPPAAVPGRGRPHRARHDGQRGRASHAVHAQYAGPLRAAWVALDHRDLYPAHRDGVVAHVRCVLHDPGLHVVDARDGDNCSPLQRHH